MLDGTMNSTFPIVLIIEQFVINVLLHKANAAVACLWRLSSHEDVELRGNVDH